MIELQFDLEKKPWEAFLDAQRFGAVISGETLLAMLENEDDSEFDEVFEGIAQKRLQIQLDKYLRNVGNGQAAPRLRQEEEFVNQGMRLDLMEDTDPLRLYLEELSAVPAFGDEETLAFSLLNGDEKASEQLTYLGLQRVVAISQEYVGCGVLMLDLIQEGSLGLWQGLQSYTEGSYIRFIEYEIRNAMVKTILLQAKNNGLGQKLRESLQDYRSVDERLLSEFGRNPTVYEIAAEMHVTADEAEMVRKMLENASVLQQAEALSKPAETEEENDMAVEDTAYFQLRQRIQELLSQLNEQDAKLLTLRFGLDMSLPRTAEETARILDLTVGEVQAKEAAALSLLRNTANE